MHVFFHPYNKRKFLLQLQWRMGNICATKILVHKLEIYNKILYHQKFGNKYFKYLCAKNSEDMLMAYIFNNYIFSSGIQDLWTRQMNSISFKYVCNKNEYSNNILHLFSNFWWYKILLYISSLWFLWHKYCLIFPVNIK